MNFLRAADAFLYLPIYIAEHRGIYRTIDKSLDAQFFTPDIDGDKGDFVALHKLITFNESGAIPIAICDPFAIFESNELCELSNFRVLGTIITRVPFWAVDGPEVDPIEEDDLGKKFKNIIYYDENLKTGHYIGKRTKQKSKISKSKSVSFGQEFPELFNPQNKDKSIAITCDIVSMAIYKNIHSHPASINHIYSKNPHYENFVTTALVTTEKYCRDYPSDIEKVLEGVQASLGIMHTSRDIALDLCGELSEKENFYHDYHKIGGNVPSLNYDQIEWIVDLIYDGDFYPKSLAISKEQWDYTIDCYKRDSSVTDEFDVLYEEGKLKYNEIVANQYLFRGQKRYISSVGIDLHQLTQEEVLQQINQETTRTINQLVEKFDSEKRSVILNTSVIIVSAISFGVLVLYLIGILFISYPVILAFTMSFYPSYCLYKYLLPYFVSYKSNVRLFSLASAFIILSIIVLYLAKGKTGDDLQMHLFFVALLFAVPTELLCAFFYDQILKKRDDKNN